MTAKKRFRRKQKKWKAWGAAIAAEKILADQEANVLFPTMCDKLQKAMAIRPEYDITEEIITEQYQSDQQKRRYAPKLQQAAVMLFADFFIFIGLLLLFYICGQYFDVLWFTGSVVMACGINSILFFLFCEWLVFYLYRIFEKED